MIDSKIILMAVAACSVLTLTSCTAADKSNLTITRSGNLAVSATIVPNPPAQGIESLTIDVRDSKNRPVNGAKVEVYTTMGAMNVNGQSVVARPKGNGLYSAAVEIGTATRWLFTVSARAGSRTGMEHIAVDVR